ncbi:MAG: FG-GAP-like repeat-containing protein [Gemmatimonadetes bacterium]|nr:FG-GAP-like repeat-containing protein [Gemmatimonadota bacterium]
MPVQCRRTVIVLAFAAGVAAVGCERERVDNAGGLITARTLGIAFLQSDQLVEAEAQFKQVIEFAPDDALGYANLALTYLRGDRVDEAEAQALRARTLDPTSVNVVLALAGVYAAQGREADARRLLEGPARSGADDPAILYALAQIDTAPPHAAARIELLQRIIAKSPTNVAVRLELLDAFARRTMADSAARALEEIRRLRPEPPAEALVHYPRALALLRAGNMADALVPLARFRAAMELTPPYQASLLTVRGPDGPMVGRPVLTFSPRLNLAERATKLGAAIQDAVRFADVTQDLGLETVGSAPVIGASTAPEVASAIAVGDYDADGDDDLFVSRWDASANAYVVRLYHAESGVLRDVTGPSRIALPGGAVWAIFADYDNDGYLDLFALGSDGSGHLFRNTGRQRFENVTTKARVGDVGGARKAIFADLDHDGDLDLAAVGPQGLRALRNNADGTFTEATALFGFTVPGAARDVAFADFDDDGRLDLFVSREGASNTLYRNAGARRFEDATAATGLTTVGGSGAVAVGDFDNDGTFDLFVAAADSGRSAIWMNGGDGTFTRGTRTEATLVPIDELAITAAQFADYDNDGWLDLVAAGTPRRGGERSLLLLRNAGEDTFEDRSALLPAETGTATTLAMFDLGRDGDEDVVVADAFSGPRVLRNAGGNANLYVQVRLAGLRTGSGKNNDFGIGAKIELRVGNVVQTRVATSPMTHFGLGAHLKADVLRIEWPNGVPQVIHFPGSDQDVLENEVLKSSCGFLYAWDGERFNFVTDVMWRSALGMPLGIMGSNTEWAPPGASQEYLRVPGSALKAKNGRYVLQLTEELWETSYTDEVRLIAVDHPDSVNIFVDERFVPPGPIALRLYQPAGARPPRTAVDERGNDVLSALRERDDIYVSDLMPTQYQGIVASHDLVMDLGADAGAPGTHLYLRGWIYPTDASINVALSQQSRLTPVMPVLEVRDASGAWRAAADIGFPSGKDKTIVIDLAGKFPTKDHHVRIRTNMQIYWDQAFVARDAEKSPVTVTTLPLLSANLHFRGVSQMYRKGGRYGPHWFDYSTVITEAVWRPITGAFTRFGDVLPLLRKPDDMYIVMAPGDETTLEFDAEAAPPPPKGWTRDFLLYSDGWIKDADMNTALGNTVGPLPFHAIRQYPYAPGEKYPDDADRQRYLREYNTRIVNRR